MKTHVVAIAPSEGTTTTITTTVETKEPLIEEQKVERRMMCGFLTFSILLGAAIMGNGIYYAAIPSEYVKSECSYEAIIDSYACSTPCSTACRMQCPHCSGQRITFRVSSSQCDYPPSSYSYTSKVCFLNTPRPAGSGTCTLKKDDPCAADSLKDFDDPLDPNFRSSSGDSTSEMLVAGIAMVVLGAIVLFIAGNILKCYFFPESKEEDLE